MKPPRRRSSPLEGKAVTRTPSTLWEASDYNQKLRRRHLPGTLNKMLTTRSIVIADQLVFRHITEHAGDPAMRHRMP